MNRVLHLLAASALTTREILDCLSDMHAMSESELLEELAEIRHFAKSRAPRRYVMKTNDMFFGRSDHSSAKSERAVAKQISQLLRDGTQLTTSQASELFLSQLRKHLSPSAFQNLPKLNKESFLTWVEKLAAYVPPSVLLHEAAKIRNQAVHGSKSAWPLGREE